MEQLTIVTSCRGYGQYLDAWAQSVLKLTQRPAQVVIVTHGSDVDFQAGAAAADALVLGGLNVHHEHSRLALDFGVARNRAVALSMTEWVMHLDCDDRIMPHALDDFAALAPNADVVSFGYERAGETKNRPINKVRIYRNGNGLEMLAHAAPASGVSPFRRSLWVQSPYRTDMRGAWDTALWIGFARLGARFRATSRPCFWYWHHPDSIYTRRRLTFDWTHAMTAAMLGSLRRNDRGAAFIIPRDRSMLPAREAAWRYTQRWLAAHHPEWPIIEGYGNGKDWSKGEAIADALMRTTADVLIVADADCLVAPTALAWTVEQVRRGAPWAIPHQHVYRASQSVTARYLAQLPAALVMPDAADLTREPYIGYVGGGIFVVRRVHYEASGGIPLAFRGWGGEDTALATILDGMIGPHVRGTADLLHLWHEPQATKKDGMLVARNNRRYRVLLQESKKGQEALWKAICTLPNPPVAVVPPWKQKALAKAARGAR